MTLRADLKRPRKLILAMYSALFWLALLGLAGIYVTVRSRVHG